MQRLLGPRLYKPSEKSDVDTASVLKDRKYVVLYFGAGWCANCKVFSATLTTFYTIAEKKYPDCLVVYVSSDRTEEAFLDVVTNVPWFAVPFRQRREKLRLSRKYRVVGIPTCLVVETINAAVVCADVADALEHDTEAEKFPWGGRTVWGVLEATPIVARGGDLIAASSLRGKTDGIALYFGAQWCGPCRLFTPRLASIYEKLRRAGTSMEVIFVSSDKSEGEYDELRSTMPWLALPWGHPANNALRRILQVQALPTLATIAPDGNTINADAHYDATDDPDGARYPWPMEELPFVSPLVASEQVVEALTTAHCFILCRNGAGNFEVAVAEFTTAANRFHAARGAALAKNGTAESDDEGVYFFVSDDSGDIVDRVFEACAAPKQPNGQSLILAVSIAHDRRKEVYLGEISTEMVLSFVERYLEAVATNP